MIIHFITWAAGKEKVETVAETDVVTSFGDTVAAIWSGQIEDVVRIVTFDTETGIGSDATKAVAKALCDKSHEDQDEPYYDLIPFIRQFGIEPYESPRHRAGLFGGAYEKRIAA